VLMSMSLTPPGGDRHDELAIDQRKPG
jgi:hypothetical protein